jgi:phenylalanyl-tRNA synthetase beta chain
VTHDVPAFLHPGRSGTLRLGANVLGIFGELHPSLVERFDLAGPAVVMEVLLDRIPFAKSKPTRTKSPLRLSGLQPVRRDFAFLLDAATAASEVLRAAQGADKALITGIEVFDIYAGPGIEAGKKSVALEVTLQPRERTLTDQEIDAVSGRVVQAVVKATGAVLRS